MKKILFIGCGNMGGALLNNLILNSGNRFDISVLELSDKELPEGVLQIKDYNELPDKYKPDYVLFAVKPQIIDEVIGLYMDSDIHSNSATCISIIAGKKIEYFREKLGDDTQIIRTMPNLPVFINEGVLAYCSYNAKDVNILDYFGSAVEVDEEDMDLVTAISGSGPAYLFLFVELLMEIGIEMGLSEDITEEIVKSTVYGASKMVLNSDKSPTELRKMVMSKGGTTEAAISVLNDGGFKEIIKNAITKAQKRSKELSE